MNRRQFVASVAASALAQRALAQQDYPARTVSILVPYAPGGTTDIIARLAAPNLSAALGKPFVVENRPGASGALAMGHVAKAAPDGHTLLANEITQSVLPALYPNLGFDPIRDLVPVSLIAETPVVLVAHPKVQANTLPELIDFAKKHPGKLNFGSGGSGSGPHLAGELLKVVAGVSIVHIPYRGSGPAIADLLGGNIDLLMSAAPTVEPHVRSGKLKALAVAGKQRVPSMPAVPTAAQAGLPQWDFSIWFGLAAPRGTPDEVLATLSREVAKMVAKPDVRERLVAVGAEPVGSTPAEYARRIESDAKRWADLIKRQGIKPD